MQPALDHFKTFIEGIDGQPTHVSQYGQHYATVAFKANRESISPYMELEARFLEVLLKCRKRGGHLIVWRTRPMIEWDEDGDLVMRARFHCVPPVAFDEEDMKPEGEPARNVAESRDAEKA